MYLRNINFDGIKNARDFGGIKNKEGREIRSHCFIRSSELSKLSDRDINKLKYEYHLSKVIDLRTGNEKAEKPDVKIGGVEYFEIPLFQESALGITHEENVEGLQMLNKLPDMCKLYRTMVTDELSLANFRKEFEIIVNHDGNSSILWHCTEGKDRCGLTSVLFLALLDVDKDRIYEDFKFTSTVSKKKADKYYYSIKYLLFKPDKARQVRKIYMADPEFLDAAYDVFDNQYGGIDAFIRNQLGISDEMKEQFKNRFLR